MARVTGFWVTMSNLGIVHEDAKGKMKLGAMQKPCKLTGQPWPVLDKVVKAVRQAPQLPAPVTMENVHINDEKGHEVLVTSTFPNAGKTSTYVAPFIRRKRLWGMLTQMDKAVGEQFWAGKTVTDLIEIVPDQRASLGCFNPKILVFANC